jgi:carbon-monoxide dehydrogenase small subunit
MSNEAAVTLSYTLKVNSTERQVVEAWVGESLLWVLRERLGLPGSKNACEQGECGSCSVLIDGKLVCSCLVLAASAVGSEIVTVEAMSDLAGEDGASMSYVQEAFLREGAVQCGFCTPGLVVAVHDLLARNPNPTDFQIREAISGNLCRCTGYGRILEAVHTASRLASRASRSKEEGVHWDEPNERRVE